MGETVDAALVRVELFEDRAAVTRRVSVPSAGRHQLRIGPLTPLMTERGLSFPGGTVATVEEVSIERIRVTRQLADPEHLRALEAEHRTTSERTLQSADALARSREHASRMSAAIDSVLATSPRALLESDAARWTDLVSALAKERADADLQLVELQIEHEQRMEEVARLERALSTARAGHPVFQGFLMLGLWAEQPTELLVRYVVPCAVWRPSHRAELVSGRGRESSAQVRFSLGAVCWNATGEDWRNVELVCSTARPGDLAKPPPLLDDLLVTRKRDREEEIEARDVAIEVARERDGRTSLGAPGVDDGGEPRTFTAETPVTIPSDGRPVSVALGSWQSSASAIWLALPERGSAAVLRTVQRNAGNKPLLAGPVALVRDGMAIGRGKIPLVASGETFPLGWGSHDGLRITRKREHKLDRALITGRQKHEFTIQVRIVHLGAEACRLEVRERIPVSEHEKVSVGAPKAEPSLDAPPDRDGFVCWTLQLEPGDQRALKLVYTIDAASNVRLPFG